MPIYIGDYLHRLLEWKKATENKSRLLINCLDSVDASLWLIAGSRIPQAVVLLHNSIEVAFKAELERIHRILIADSRKLDYTALKSLLKEAFKAHPQGQKMKIPEFDMERTITFNEAMERVKELYPMVGTWKPRLNQLQSLRNEIVHYGFSDNLKGQCADAIAATAYPFLEEFLEDSSSISLEKMVTPDVMREIRIAKNLCERLKQENKPIGNYVLNTLALKMLYTHVEWPRLSDITGTEDGREDYELAEATRKEIEKEWGDYYIQKGCHICDSLNLFVKVAPVTSPRRDLSILAAKCPKCGLDILEEEEYLAEYHVGKLSSEEIGKFFEDGDM